MPVSYTHLDVYKRQAIASMAAQNMGAGRPERARATLNAGVLSSLAAAVIFFAWAQAAPTSIMAIFRADPQVAAAGADVYKRQALLSLCQNTRHNCRVLRDLVFRCV